MVEKKKTKKLNENALRKSRLLALGELSATAAHDIRSPLAVIQLTCEDLAQLCATKQNIESSEVKNHINYINRAVSKIKKLVDHMSDYARGDSQEMEEPKEISTLIEESLFLIEQKIRQFKVRVINKITPEMNSTQLLCFPNRFEQLLSNLLGNACDAMRTSPSRELIIDARFEKGFLLLSVQDTGVGISDEIKPKVFDVFFTTKPKGEGIGLGLNIVHDIVKEHRGSLLMSSKLGEGTTFIVKIPGDKLISSENQQQETTRSAA